MEINIHYSNLKDRANKVTENQSKGLRMIQDNFDAGYKKGQVPSGTMIFTDMPEKTPVVVIPPRDAIKELDALIKKLQIAGVIPLTK